MKFIIIDDEHELYKRMYTDILQNQSDDIIEVSNFQKLSKVLKILEKVLYNRRLNRHIKVPFKKLYNRYYTLSSYNFDPKEKYWIIILNGTLCSYYSEEYLLNLKRCNSNIKLAMVLYDSFSNRSAKRAISLIPAFDVVFSFDERNAHEYGLKYIYSTFSTPDYLKVDENYKSSAFFIGNGADREQELNENLSYIAQNVKDSKFGIVGVKQEKYKGLIDYNEPISYREELMYAYNTNCIVEIVKQGQSGITLRTCEAIAFNKKLLTNNTNIKNQPFYNSKYISIFENIEDIDIDFIKKDIIVDYQYDGCFSPMRIIDCLKEERWEDNGFSNT